MDDDAHAFNGLRPRLQKILVTQEHTTVLQLKNTAVAVLVVVGASLGVARAAARRDCHTLDDAASWRQPGKEAVMITVEYPPGGADPVHRHHAHGFIYVLEGSIVMQVKGGKEVTLTPGQTFYEGPNDIHTVGRNASQTQPAKFIVLLLKDKGAPILIPEK
jgi:quercetin dioxygenase-like cupin family protein